MMRVRIVLLSSLFAALWLASSASPVLAAEMLSGKPGEPLLPAIPDAADVVLTIEEWKRIEAGEIVLQMLAPDDVNRQARAIGYLRHHPRWLFEIASDTSLSVDLVPEVKSVEVLEEREFGEVFLGSVEVFWLLPAFEYRLVAAYDETRMGQSWAQIEGDFERNDGSHSFLWDPVREKTLGVFSIEFELKGLLGLVPESIVLRMASRTLPGFMRDVDAMIDTIAAEDPERAARVERDWQALRPRLDGGQLPGRVWRGPQFEAASAAPSVH